MNLMDQLYQFNTAEISDALDACGIEGALLGIRPLTLGTKLMGPAFTVKYIPYTEKLTEFKDAGNYIDEVPPNSVIVIDNNGRDDCTTWGDILTQVAIRRNIAGTVIHGAVRDIHFIREIKYPLYSSSIYMRSGKNRVYKAMHQCELTINNVSVTPDDVIFGDDNGVLVIPKTYINDVIDKAKNIKITEDQIITVVKAGMPLKSARKYYRYDQPWLNCVDKK